MRPTLSELITSTLSSIRLSLGLVVSTRRTVIESISNSFCGVLYLLYVYVDNLFSSFFPQDGNEEVVFKWGEMINLPRKAASFAKMAVTAQGLAGSTITQGVQLRSVTGGIYTVDEDITFTETTQSIPITAILPGSSFNLSAGENLNFVIAVSGVESQVQVSALTNDADDIEPLTDYRNRILDFMSRKQYRAGGIEDYIGWAKEVPGIGNAYVIPKYQGVINRVGVMVLSSGESNIPTEGEISEVREYLRLREPVTADVLVFAPEEESVDFNIQIRRNTQAIRNEVTANLRELFALRTRPSGTVEPDGSVNTGIIYISQVREAVSIAAGEFDNVIDKNENIAPSEPNSILTLGNITFTTLVS